MSVTAYKIKIMNKVRVLDKGKEFLTLMWLDFDLASSLNVGDSILPDGTGFTFIVVDKLVSKEMGCSDYELRLDVVEYFTFFESVKKWLYGGATYGYWDWYKNKQIQNNQ